MSRRDSIRALVAEGVETAPEIAERLGAPPVNISREMYQLVDRGEIIGFGLAPASPRGGNRAVKYRLAAERSNRA